MLSVLTAAMIITALIGSAHIKRIPSVNLPVMACIIASGRGPMAEAAIITILAEPCILPSPCLP